MDPYRITQVLANLLRNALAATPPGGTVTVTTSYAGHPATVEVTDPGRGIAPADLERIFERFVNCSTYLLFEPGGQVAQNSGRRLSRTREET